MIKRLIAMLAATALLAGSIVFYYHKTGTRTDGVYYEATGIRPDAAILTVNGDAVSAEEYFYWLDSVCEYLASSLNAVPDFSAALTEDMTLGQYAKADAVNTVTLYAVARQMAREAGVTLAQEDIDALDAQRAQYVAYYGGEEIYAAQLQILGVTEELLRSIDEVPYLYNRMYQQFADPAGKLYPGEEALRTFGQEQGYVTAQLLYLTAEGLDEEAAADMKAKAADYAAQLQAAADKQGTYETLAAQLGLTTSEAGLTFSAADADAALYQAVAALAPGQVSSVIETEGGCYVALGMEPNYASLAEVLFNIRLQERQDSAKVEYSGKLYDSIDVTAFYTALYEARAALMQQLAGQS